ncbi:unnamed protein product [marine sediment metagenome]|uniref:Uncharacterized protein n=1 Tax=marine sediment metagenome TaxID=412755 RepID=X1QT51_9ZZZZ
MDYEMVKEYLTSIRAELLAEDQFAERWRVAMGDETYMHPYGCLACGRANGQHDFNDVLFAIYPESLPNDGDKEINWGVLGIGGPDSLRYTSIGRCKFCGQCDVEPDY